MQLSDWQAQGLDIAGIIRSNAKDVYELDCSELDASASDFNSDIVTPLTHDDGSFNRAAFDLYTAKADEWLAGVYKDKDLLSTLRTLIIVAYGCALSAEEGIRQSNVNAFDDLASGAHYIGLLQNGGWEEKVARQEWAETILEQWESRARFSFEELCEDRTRQGDFDAEVVSPMTDDSDFWKVNRQALKECNRVVDELSATPPTFEDSHILKLNILRRIACHAIVAQRALAVGSLDTASVYANELWADLYLLYGTTWGMHYEQMSNPRGVVQSDRRLVDHLRIATTLSVEDDLARIEKINEWCATNFLSYREKWKNRAVTKAAKQILDTHVVEGIEITTVQKHVRSYMRSNPNRF